MIGIINYALIALSSLTGKSLCNTSHDFNQLYDEKALQSFELENSNINYVYDVYGMSGLPEYQLHKFDDDTYQLEDKYTGKIVEYGYLANSPYKNVENNFVIRTENEHFEYDYISNKFISFETNEFLTKDYFRDSDWGDYVHYCTSTSVPNGTFIDNCLYFDNLNSKFGNNDLDICGITATEILLGYYDTFVNDNIVPEECDETGDYTALTQLSGDSPGTDKPLLACNNKFRNLLIEEATNCNHVSPVNSGMTNEQVKRLVESYLDNQSISCTVTSYPAALFYDDLAEQMIDNNKPFIASLSDHFVVVYGYDDDYYYAEIGWLDSSGNDTGSIPKEWFTNFSTPYILSININNHVHSNNYYNSSNHGLYCGCSYHHSNRLIMTPSDWGFEAQYYFYQKLKTVTKDGITFNTKRLRTGYIESSVVNLSPRRSGAGNAFFQMLFPDEVYYLNYNAAWWSESEHNNDGVAYLKYHLIDELTDNWHGYLADYNDMSISYTHYSLTSLRLSLPEECDGLMFYLENLAVGDRNLGRLSLGTMIIDYYVNPN